MSSNPAGVVESIRSAFPEEKPPAEDTLFRANLTLYRPFEAEELRHELAGKRWTELSDDFADTHPDWLVYLSPEAFRYYLPAWLLYSLDYAYAGYTADFTASYLSGPDPGQPLPRHQAQHLGALDDAQREAVLRWFEHLVETNPEDDPGWLKQRGITVEDIRNDLEALA